MMVRPEVGAILGTLDLMTIDEVEIGGKYS
jgi:hypothetical protein